MKNLKLFSALVILLLFVFSSCRKDKDAPEIPPKETFIMDFSNFNNAQDTTTKSTKATEADTIKYRNWGSSFLTVAVWNTIIAVTAAVPIASFREAFNHTPEYKKKEWIWTYSVQLPSGVYTCKLHGKNKDTQVEWNMYISKKDGFSDFLWYSGLSQKDGMGGTWTLYESPNKPNPFIDIVWSKNANNEVGSIKYTNATSTDAKGSYIAFSISAGAAYNAQYVLFGAKENKTTIIEWNRTYKNGRIQSPVFYNDDSWHCWNEKLQDITCPN